MESVAISGAPRQEVGKKASKALRKEKVVPCVIYGGENVIHFSAHANQFRSLIYTPDFKLAKIDVDGTTYDCIIKETQFHPVTDEISHIDFVQLIPGKKVKVQIPVKFNGSAPGVKEGGKLIQKLRRVKIKTTPEQLVEALYADVSELNLGSSIRVRDIETTDEMEVMSAMSIPIASIEIPRALRSAQSEEEGEEGEEGAEAATEAAAE